MTHQSKTIDGQMLTWLLVVSTGACSYYFFRLTGSDTNKTPKVEEIKLSDSISNVSIVI